MRNLLNIVQQLALVFAVLVLTPAAAHAQKADLTGTWVMQGCWDSNCSTFTETFDLAGDGTFQAQGYADSGPWTVTGSQFTMTVTSNSNNTVYRGTIAGPIISGTMRDQGGATGTFSLQRATGPVAEQARLLRGSWTGTAHWNSGDAPFVLVFNADGTFHVDNGKNGQWGNGSWLLSGSDIVIRYTGSDNTVFSGTISGDTISGVTADSHGNSGTFTASRQ